MDNKNHPNDEPNAVLSLLAAKDDLTNSFDTVYFEHDVNIIERVCPTKQCTVNGRQPSKYTYKNWTLQAP